MTRPPPTSAPPAPARRIADWELGALEADLRARAARVEEAKAGIDPHGMTRPQRTPRERQFLAARGGLGPFRETSVAARPPVQDGPGRKARGGRTR